MKLDLIIPDVTYEHLKKLLEDFLKSEEEIT